MTDLSNKDGIEIDPKPMTGIQRYLTWSFWGAVLCSAFVGLVYLYLMETRFSRDSGAGLAMEGLLILCFIPCAVSLANLALAAFVAIFFSETRLAGGFILTMYIGALSYYYYHEHRDERHAFRDLTGVPRLACNACLSLRLAEMPV
ncbi:fatty acid desaturase [Oxalobacteraceae bacterium GrIS 1.11]